MESNKEESRLQTCMHCRTEVKLTTFTELKPGSHVVFPRKCECFHLYSHHAIVKDVSIESDMKAELTFIEYTTVKTDSCCCCACCSCCHCSIKVHESKKTFDLSKDTIMIVVYTGKTNTPEEVLNKAETLIGETKYNPCARNCEHFATTCMLNDPHSTQTDGWCHCLGACVWRCILVIFRFMILFGTSTPKYYKLFTDKVPYVMASFTSIIMLLAFVWETFRLCCLWKGDQLCCKCYRQQLKLPFFRLVLAIVVYGLIIGVTILFESKGYPDYVDAIVCLCIDVIALVLGLCMPAICACMPAICGCMPVGRGCISA
jgi:hypothetical protein